MNNRTSLLTSTEWCDPAFAAKLMLAPHQGLQFWLCTQPTDMRKSFDGLTALVKKGLQKKLWVDFGSGSFPIV